MTEDPPDQDLAHYLLWGVSAIAGHIGLTERQTHYLLETGAIPAGKVRRRWCASRPTLTKHFIQLTGGKNGDQRN